MAEHTQRKASVEAKEEKPAGAARLSAPEDAPPPVVPDESPRVSVDRLVRESQDFLGIPTYVAAGAFHGESGDLTVEQAKQRVQDWLETPAGEGA